MNMKARKWSKSWKASKKPRKQRKYVRNAPAHVRGKFLGSHLSPELRKKLKCRSLRVRKGDKVKVMRGTFKGKIGTVDKVDVCNAKVYVTGVEIVKKDGSKALRPLQPSKLMIQSLEGSEKRRLGEKK